MKMKKVTRAAWGREHGHELFRVLYLQVSAVRRPLPCAPSLQSCLDCYCLTVILEEGLHVLPMSGTAVINRDVLLFVSAS